VSLRLTLLNTVSRHVVRPRLARVATPAAVRRDFALFAVLARPPRGTRQAERPAAPPCPPLVRVTCGPVDPRRTILWLHGGGFIAGSPRSHRALAGWLSRLSGLAVVLPDYRLAPEHPFPAAQDDARAAWEALRGERLAPGEIALGGDSAGGSLALGLLADLCARDERPAALVGFSPLTDLTGSGASHRENARAERLLPAERLDELARYAVGDHPRDDPRVSPLFAEFRDPPPVLLQVADTEILRDDALRMASALRAAGGRVDAEVWPDAPHVWQAVGGLLPEARAAIARAAAFLRDAFGLPPRDIS
jgi:acetyl esterase/lipase